MAIRQEAASSTLQPFVEAVVGTVPDGAAVGVQGDVRENDRLVLAYHLHRSLVRIPRDATRHGLMIVPQAAASRLAPDCTPRVSGQGAREDALVLVDCPSDSLADERRQDAVGR